MPRKSSRTSISAPVPGVPLIHDKTKAKAILAEIKGRIPGLINRGIDSREFEKWQHDATIAVANVFGKHSDNDTSFCSIRYYPLAVSFDIYGTQYGDPAEAFRTGLMRADALLESMLEQLDLYWPEESNSTPSTLQSALLDLAPTTREVFVVHGHNDGLLQATARLLMQLDLEPIILHEQANQGQTIIEKFEANADVSYAVILATGDDQGRKLPADAGARESVAGLALRPRQNVVFEMGYFIGRLGRGKVCTITEPGVELQSDIQGMVYVEHDTAGSWKFRLAKEIRAAGIEIDMNQV